MAKHSLARTNIYKYNYANEGRTDGRMEREKEKVFYVKVSDVNQIFPTDKFKRIKQEQWEINVARTTENSAGGRIRVRKETIDGKTTITQTIKTTIALNDSIEATIPITEDLFTQVKQMSTGGMIKERVTLSIDSQKVNNIIEVDLFPIVEGGYHQWVKVDIELNDMNVGIPTLPFNYLEILESGIDSNDKKIQNLFNNYFITKNMFLLPTK